MEGMGFYLDGPCLRRDRRDEGASSVPSTRWLTLCGLTQVAKNKDKMVDMLLQSVTTVA